MTEPTFFDRMRLAVRTFLDPRVGAWEYLMSDYGRGSAAGVSVSETSALRFSPVWAGVSILARDIAKLPLVLFRNLPNGGKERFTTHPLYRVLHDEANPEMSSFKFRETMQALTILWGNGYAEIVRDDLQRVRGLYPIAPYRVTPIRDEDSGQLAYRVQNPSGRQSLVAPRNMLHLSSLSLDGIIGEAVTSYAAESIGLGIAAEKFGGSFFGNGTTFGGVVQYDIPLKEETKKAVRESIEAVHAGVERAHKVLVLAGGAKWIERGTKPNEAQFLETRKFQVNEVARWLTMPPHKLGDLENAHFTNIEEEEIGYHKNTLAGWIAMWEQELRRKLISPLEYSQQTIAHVMQGAMRGNSQQRAEFYTKLFNLGAMSPNDILRLEDMNPIGAAGDVHMVPLNMIPVERYQEWIDVTLEAKKPQKIEAPPQAPTLPPADDPKDDATRALREALQQSIDRAEQHAATVARLETVVASTKEEALALALEKTRAQQVADEARADAHKKQGELSRLDAELAHARQANQLLDEQRVAQALAMQELTNAKTKLEDNLQATTEEVRSREKALAAAQAELMTAREQATQSANQAASERREIDERLQRAMADVTERETSLADARGALVSLQAKHAALEVELQTRATALQAAEQKRAEAEAAAADQAQRAESAEQQRRADAEARAAAAKDHAAAHDAIRTQLEAQTTAVKAAESRAAAAEAERAQIAQRIAEAERVSQEATEAKAQSESRAADAAAALQEARVKQAELETRLQAEGQWRASMILAVRSSLVDAYRRIARTEVERARRRSANPDVLRRWVAAFYDEHGRDTVAEILRPAVHAQLVLIRSEEDPGVVSRRMAQTYCDQSVSQLAAIADGMDGEEFQTTIQRLLGTWEQERPQTVAEKVLADALHTLVQ